MKLSASINFYNAEELLIQAVRCIRPLVEHLSIVYQETSNWGNVISERAKKVIEQLKSEGLVDDFYCYEPNSSFNASENEFQKRQIGLDLAKTAGASHFLLMDADEFYIPKQFLKVKEIIRTSDISYSCVRSYFYIHQSIYRSELPDTTNVCFIAKITPELSFEYQGAFPAENVDPTRRLVNSSGRFKFFDANDICMHHMNFVRESFKSKLVNTSSAANPDFIRKAKNALNDWRWPNDFVFPNKPKYKIVEVEDVFQLQKIKYVYQVQPKKKVLLTNYFIREFTGSEMAIFDLAREFLKRGYDVTIGAFIFSDPLLSEFASLGVTLLDLNNASTEHFSLIWAQHFITLDTCLIDSGITADKIIYSSLSPYESLESPPVSVKYVNLFLANSSETKNVLVSMGLDECDVIIFPNPVNQSFFSKKKINSQGLKRLAIVSNHIPTEIEQVAEQLRQKGVEVKEFGMLHEFVLITPEVLNNFDAVITIGRTVQYCLAMGIPIYCYDRFGGPGWINIDNIDRAALYNFSGRCVGTKKQADDIESELINNFETTQTQAKFYEEYAKLHFDLENQLDRVLGSLISGQKTDIEQCPKTVLNIINRQRKFTQDLIRNILHNNHIISEKDHIISEKDHIISEKDHIVLNREQQLLSQTHKYNKYKKLWTVRLMKPIIKTEQAISSANTLRKGFRRLIKEKGSIGKGYQHLRRLKKSQGTKAVKALLRATATQTAVSNVVDTATVGSGYHYAEPVCPRNIDDILLNMKNKPLFSIVVPVYNTPINLLDELIQSIKSQWYQNWELILVDDCSPNHDLKNKLYDITDSQIKVVFLEKNSGISKATNAGIDISRGEYIVFVDHDDLITVDCLYELALCIDQDNPDMIYSDEDKIDEHSRCYSQPHFKPDWSPDSLMSVPCIAHVVCVRKEILNYTGLLRSEVDGCQDWDLTIRIAEYTQNIKHIPKVLYHWRIIPQSIASNMEAKPYVLEASKKTRIDAFQRRGLNGVVEPIIGDKTQFRVNYLPRGNPLISIIIPTRDNARILKNCVYSILENTQYLFFEVIIIDNGSVESDTINYLKEISKHEKVQVVPCDIPFNFSKLSNLGAEQANGEVLLFLNDDTEVIQSDWLERMLGYAQLPHIGAVGAQLLYPKEKLIQHAGVINLLSGPAHAFARLDPSVTHYFYRTKLEYNWIAVTGACLMIEKKKFELIGRFDEGFPVAYNDVALCFSALQNGLYNIVCQSVNVYHYESISRGSDYTDEKKRKRLEKDLYNLYSKFPMYYKYDPFYNVNLHPTKTNFELNL